MKLLLAGATGQLGAGVIEAAADREGVEVLPGARATRRRSSAERIGRLFPQLPEVEVHGLTLDVGQPLWGLESERISQLAEEVDVVLNAAAETNWAAEERRHFQVNTLGAVHGYELAQTLGRLSGRQVVYCYTSTIHAAGGREGLIPEQRFGPDRFRTPYEHCKWLAEEALFEKEATPYVAPLAIRIGGLVGDSRSGATARRNSLYMLADRWHELPRGLLPLAKMGRVDMVPRDRAATMLLDLIAAACADHSRCGGIYHVCAGESAPTAEALLAAVRSLDAIGAKASVRTVDIPSRWALTATQGMRRFRAIKPAWQNMVTGLRYLSLDRVFDRSRLRGALGYELPGVSADELARICFGVGAPSAAPLPPDSPVPSLSTFRE